MATTNKITPLLLVLALLGWAGCERFYLDKGDNYTQVDIFEEAWTFTKQEYSYFELKGVDWDFVKTQYEPLVYDNMSNDSLFTVIDAMLDELEDGHNNLTSPFDRSRSWDWYLDYPENYNGEIIERYYYQGNQRFVGPIIYLDLDSLAYLSYRSFSNEISDENLEALSKLLANKKGVVLDIRNNGGGSIFNADKLAGFFTDVDYLAGYERFKIGPGPNDFSDFIESEVKAYEGDSGPFTGEVVLLTNRKSYSASTFFSMYLSANPRATLLGDQTGGGGGGPAYTELRNGWSLRVSGSQTIDKSGYQIELGVVPDVYQQQTSSDTQQNKDSLIEAALALLRS